MWNLSWCWHGHQKTQSVCSFITSSFPYAEEASTKKSWPISSNGSQQTAHIKMIMFMNAIFFYYKLALCHVCMRAQSCPTLCDPMDSSPPCSSVHEFSRQEYWSGLPYPSPGDFANPRIKPVCLASSALAGGLFTNWATREALEVLKSSKSNPCLHPMKVTFVELFICAHTQAINPSAPTFHCIVNGLSLVRPELSAYHSSKSYSGQIIYHPWVCLCPKCKYTLH